jgi:hypothetical protein
MDNSIRFFFQGRFTIAAKQHMAIAEIYESSVIDLEKVRFFATRPMEYKIPEISFANFWSEVVH